MSPRNRLKSLVIVAALAAAATTPAASASSTPADDDCVAGPTGATRCFGTYRQAIAHASHGRITDAPKDARKAAGDRRLRTKLRRLGAAPAADRTPTDGPNRTKEVGDGGGEIIAATLFDDQGFGGGSYTVTAGAPCKKDGLIEWQIDLPPEWHDRVSSVQPWGNCWIWLYPETGLGGDRDGPFKENTSYVGARLDNRTKSVGLS